MEKQEKMTKKEAIANHRKLWLWIAQETKRRRRKVEKIEYFKEHHISGKERPTLGCYCCAYTFGQDIDCDVCPVQWANVGDYKNTPCTNSEFGKWKNSTTWQEASHWALIIAFLSEREDVK